MTARQKLRRRRMIKDATERIDVQEFQKAINHETPNKPLNMHVVLGKATGDRV